LLLLLLCGKGFRLFRQLPGLLLDHFALALALHDVGMDGAIDQEREEKGNSTTDSDD
jgi:hypothetical protein